MIKHRKFAFSLVLIILISILILSPNMYDSVLQENLQGYERVEALVKDVDNSDFQQTGVIKRGTQNLTLQILEGTFEGTILTLTNLVIGNMEIDELFMKGDSALVIMKIDYNENKIVSANVKGHYRFHVEIFLFLAFVLLLVVYARWTGVNAVLSFIFTALFIWKVLFPGFLKGYNPILLSLGVVTILSAVIIFAIGELSKKGLVAFLGAFCGILLTGILAFIFGSLFKVHGTVRPFAQALLNYNLGHLDLNGIFLSGVFIASSGAVMDLAMDISASMNEVIEKNPAISINEAIKSGFTVGRAVVGTMTTTLLLAYSGGYTFLFMVYMVQGTPLINMFNLHIIAAEVLHTLVGSFGLVTVAPFTAIVGGFIFLKKKNKQPAKKTAP